LSLDNTKNSNVANKFNLFYIQDIDNIIKSINDTLENSKGDTNTYNKNREFLQHFGIVTIEEIEGIIRQLPRKKGTDEGISTDIIKAAWYVIREEFVDIINSSLNEGTCPEVWKTSTIKIDQPKKASQFRPINMLPTFEKVLELVVRRQLDEYLENNIIAVHQLSFRKEYSCETVI